MLFAQRKGGPVLKYVGGVKFARTGHAGEICEQTIRDPFTGDLLKRQLKV